ALPHRAGEARRRARLAHRHRADLPAVARRGGARRAGRAARRVRGGDGAEEAGDRVRSLRALAAPAVLLAVGLAVGLAGAGTLRAPPPAPTSAPLVARPGTDPDPTLALAALDRKIADLDAEDEAT